MAEVQELLGFIPPDCGYSDWVAVLMGLHDHFNGAAAGLTIAENWSSGGVKYKPGEVAAKWRSFQAGGGAGWGSVCTLARQNGADLGEIAKRHEGRQIGFSALRLCPIVKRTRHSIASEHHDKNPNLEHPKSA